MRAIQATAFGGPAVLRPVDLPEPVPEDGQLIISVTAANVGFLDTQLRAGWGQEFFAVTPPYVPGGIVSGTVLAVGADTPTSWIGRRVVASSSEPGKFRGGGYAERVAVPVSTSHVVPDGVDLVDALAAHDGLMAVSRIARAGLRPGDSALVTAASGSIGVWLVPLLKEAGVRVLAAAGGPEKTALATKRGADLVLDYTQEGWTAGVEGSVDAVFDGAGGSLGGAAFELVRPGGRFFAYGAASGGFAEVPEHAPKQDVKVIGIHDGYAAEELFDAHEQALTVLAQHRLEPVVGLRLPLERAAEAHRALEERRVLGKTVLTP